METITGVIVCPTSQRRNQLRNRLTTYAGRVNADPTAVDVPAGKYGAGPTLLVLCWFGNDPVVDRAAADAAWTLLEGFLNDGGVPWVMAGSYVEQVAGETSTRVQRLEWRDDGAGGTEVVDLELTPNP